MIGKQGWKKCQKIVAVLERPFEKITDTLFILLFIFFDLL